jgi:hypothetical protein
VRRAERLFATGRCFAALLSERRDGGHVRVLQAEAGLALKEKMAMTAYFDESGTHGDESPVVTIAGLIASSDQWSSYERDLSQLMDEYG